MDWVTRGLSPKGDKGVVTQSGLGDKGDKCSKLVEIDDGPLIAINATTLPPIKRRWPYGPGVRSPFSRFLALMPVAR